MAAAPSCLFDEDEVCLKTNDNKHVYGLVVENADYMSSDDEDEEDRLKKGTVRIAWHPDGRETVEEDKKLVLADRSLMPGDVVRRLIHGKSSPRGFVQDTKVKCHFNIKGTNKYILDVDSKDICTRGFDDLFNKCYDHDHPDVTMDSWVGKMIEVIETVTLLFPDGAMCRVQHVDDLDGFESINDRQISEAPDSAFSSEGMFYRGKILRGKLGDLEKAEWIQRTNKYNSKSAKKNARHFVNVRIEKTEVTCVKIHWLFRGFGTKNTAGNDMDVPPSRVEKDQLCKLNNLDWFTHCSVQLGDKASYKIKPMDKIVDVRSKFHPVPDILSKNSENERGKFAESHAEETSPDVSQGTASKELDSSNGVAECDKEAMDCDHADDKEDENDEEYEDVESSASDHTEENVITMSSKTSHNTRRKRKTKVSKKSDRRSKSDIKFSPPFPTFSPGETVPVEVCYTYSEATVIWQDGEMEENIPSPELVPIHHLDELEFFPGDYVVPDKDADSECYGAVISADHVQRTCLVKWMKVVDLTKGQRPESDVREEEVSVYDIKDHPDFKFRPLQAVIHVGEPIDINEQKYCVGQVYRLDPRGTVVVKWPDGKETHCYPQELYIAGDEMSDSESEWSSDDSDSDSDDSMDSWETENEEEVDSDAEETVEGGKMKILRISKDKKEELDKFLLSSQESLKNLENYFVLAKEKSIQISYPNLKDLMSIYKKCQEWEKIVKTSYFDDPEVKILIEQLKEHLQEEKRNEMNQHILRVHKSRQSIGSTPEKEKTFVEVPDLNTVTYVETKNQSGDKVPSNSCTHYKDDKDSSNETCVSENSMSHDNPGVESDKCTIESGAEGCDEDLSVSSPMSVDADLSDKVSSDEKNTKRAELCRRICYEIHSRIAVIKEEMDKRWAFTLSKTAEALAKFGNVDITKIESKAEKTSNLSGSVDISNSECASNGAEGGMQMEGGASIEGATAVKESTLLSDVIKNMVEDDVKAILHRVIQDDKGCGLLEEVILGMDSDRSGAKSPDLPTIMENNYRDIITADIEGFHLSEEVPTAHKFSSREYNPVNTKSFISSMKKELKLLQSSLPKGIVVKGFEDRMDLFSVMIIGPAGTPYEDALFFFDVMVPADYPISPPVFHYISYCKDRLNPNLYEDGKVCVSLLGTWDGKGNEVWTDKSSLLQVLISIQGLILVAEPYYNEAGYEKQRGSQQGHENSMMYSEMAILKVFQSTSRMIDNPPHSFLQEMTSHLRMKGPRMIKRVEKWINASMESRATSTCSSHQQMAESIEPETTGNDSKILRNDEHVSSVKLDSDTSSSSTIDNTESMFPKDKNTPSKYSDDSDSDVKLPEFPLLPASKGFCITMKKHLLLLQNSLDKLSMHM